MSIKTFQKLLSPLLAPISLLYGATVQLRHVLYDLGFYSSTEVQPIVVSIGNISSGGTGKTPWTLKIAQDLKKESLELAILSRGYRSKFEHLKNSTLICDKKGPLYLASECGDEPTLICQNLPEIYFYCGKNRAESAKLAEKKGAEIILLDDGFQHRKLKRDFDCVLMNANSVLQKDHFLPLGYLRDSYRRLKMADLVIVNRVKDKRDIAQIERKLKKWTLAPTVYTQYEPLGFYSLNAQRVDPPKKIAAYSGLADNSSFYQSLKDFELVGQKNLVDHKAFEPKHLKAWVEQMKLKGAKAIVCTEKDAVKLTKEYAFLLPIYYLKVAPKILLGEENYQKFLKKIRTQKKA